MNTQPRRRPIFALGTTTLALALARCEESSENNGTGSSTTLTAPGIVGPNGSDPLGDNQPTLTVTNVTVSTGAAPTYTFQVATDQAFTATVAQASGIAQGSGQTSWEVSQPLNQGSYFWRARGDASGTAGPYSAVAQFSILGVGGPGETVVVFDDLTDGATLATDREGGTLTPQGWRVNDNTDYLRYDVPTVDNGYVQWQNVGLTPRGVNDASHMLFGMWDPTAGAYRQNAFRVHVQKLWGSHAQSAVHPFPVDLPGTRGRGGVQLHQLESRADVHVENRLGSVRRSVRRAQCSSTESRSCRCATTVPTSPRRNGSSSESRSGTNR